MESKVIAVVKNSMYYLSNLVIAVIGHTVKSLPCHAKQHAAFLSDWLLQLLIMEAPACLVMPNTACFSVRPVTAVIVGLKR